MMSDACPNLKYKHVYVVVRVDMEMLLVAEGDLERQRIEDSVVVTRVFEDWNLAVAEADRLNELNGAKGCVYFARVGRL